MSTSTAIPSGPLPEGSDWCIQSLLDFGDFSPPYAYNECFNSSRGTQKSSFQTICCDGNIVDTETNLWSVGTDYTKYSLDLSNLICCREGGRMLPGGLLPLDSDYTHCSPSQSPTPLASLAATNTQNAALYAVTYESASGFGTKVTDWTTTGTPTCLWIETASGKAPLTTVEVPKADITTLPPPTTDVFGMPIESESSRKVYTLTGVPTISGLPRPSNSTGSAPASESTGSTASSTSSAPSSTASSGATVRSEGRLVLALFGVAAGLSVLAML